MSIKCLIFTSITLLTFSCHKNTDLTVSNDCEISQTGVWCIKNTFHSEINVQISGNAVRSIILEPGVSECFTLPFSFDYFIATITTEDGAYFYPFQIQVCERVLYLP